eukprot:11157896-Lingulodinium_polyedra.AAC.1
MLFQKSRCRRAAKRGFAHALRARFNVIAMGVERCWIVFDCCDEASPRFSSNRSPLTLPPHPDANNCGDPA